MKQLTRILLVAVLASACAHTPSDSEGVRAPRMEDAILPMARAALESGQVETARRLHQRLLDVNPDSFEARMGLGDIELKAGETRAAAQWYLSAVERAEQPRERHEALLAHGRAALAAGELEAARESFTRLTEPAESAPQAAVAWGHNGIGLTLMLDGDLPGAQAALERAVQLAPGDLRFQGNLDRLVSMLPEPSAAEVPADEPVTDPTTVAAAGDGLGDASPSPQQSGPIAESGDATANSEQASPKREDPGLNGNPGLPEEDPAPVHGTRNPKRLAPALASIAVAALGQDSAVVGSDLSVLTLERDEFTDKWVDASLWLFTGEETAEREWLTWNCHHAGTQLDDTPYFRVQASAVRKSPRKQESAAERVRFRVDKNPMHQWQSIGVVDWNGDRHGFTGTGTANILGPLELLGELAAGNRLIVQVGNLPMLLFDLTSAKPDIVEFKATCDRLYADRRG